MTFRIFSAIALGLSMMATTCLTASALADGMPFSKKMPEPVLSPLDYALDEIQNTAPVVAPPTEALPEPQQAAEQPAAEMPPPVPETRIVEVQENTSFFGLSVGMYDITHGDKAASFNIEWQPGLKIGGALQPLLGALATTNGSLMGYAGVGIPFRLGQHVFLMPSVSAGAYHEGGGYDLDHTLAFRIGTEFSYEFDDKSRVGLNAHILTNGTSTHRNDRTEIIGLAYTTPFSGFSGASDTTATPQ